MKKIFLSVLILGLLTSCAKDLAIDGTINSIGDLTLKNGDKITITGDFGDEDYDRAYLYDVKDLNAEQVDAINISERDIYATMPISSDKVELTIDKSNRREPSGEYVKYQDLYLVMCKLKDLNKEYGDPLWEVPFLEYYKDYRKCEVFEVPGSITITL